MSNLKELIEKGTEIRNAISKNRSKAFSESLKEKASIWKNQCAFYVDSLKLNKFVLARFNTAVMNFGYNGRFNIDYIDDILAILKALPQEEDLPSSNNGTAKPKSNEVFIVHGHNKNLRTEVKAVLYEMGLKPIILSEQANRGKTIIEKFEAKSSRVNYAIILMTADDTGKANLEIDYKPRARQNVILEMGYFMARIKRSNMFLLLEDDNIEIPSDISGVVHCSVNEDWKHKLAHELKECGYKVTSDDISVE